MSKSSEGEYFSMRLSPQASTAARWLCVPQKKYLTADCDSQFCVSFSFCIYREALRRLETSLNWS